MKPLTKNTEVVLGGVGKVTLRPNDYVTTGGEGSIYRLKNMIVKLYTDNGKISKHNMDDKITELSKLSHKYIVAPKGLVFSEKGLPIGYYMDYVNGEPLSRVFTNDFRNREGFGDKEANTLNDRMHEVVRFAHQNSAILVDANELNWIMVMEKMKDPTPRAIDVDSWAIGRWPATVVMPSIKDWHSKKFGEMSDWFAWGIVTFQVYTGIHPYKGKLDGFGQGDLEARMKANASVFQSGIRLNRAVRDFSIIPGPLLDWYRATFQDGDRSTPPSPLFAGLPQTKFGRVLRVTTTSSGNLRFVKLFGKVGDNVTRVFICGLAQLTSGKLIDLSNAIEIGNSPADCEVVQIQGGWVVAYLGKNEPEVTFINNVNHEQTKLNLNIAIKRFVRFENRLFVVTAHGLSELNVIRLSKPILSVGQTWGAMEQSTRWFDGVGIQDAMGAMYVIAPFGEKACAHVRVKELDEFRVLSAKTGNRFISIVTVNNKGEYRIVELTLDKDYKQYSCNEYVVDSPEHNIVILPKGVCASIIDDGELKIFVPTSATLNKISDKTIATDMQLASWENKVLYIQNGEVWSLSMK